MKTKTPPVVRWPLLTSNKLNLCNDFISMEPDCIDCFCINFPQHCVLGHVLSDSDPLNDVDSWKEVVQPFRKPRSVGPRKSKPTKSTNQKMINQKNKKSRRVTVEIAKKPRSVMI